MTEESDLGLSQSRFFSHFRYIPLFSSFWYYRDGKVFSMITSLSNPLVKHLVKLREDKKYRKMQGSVIISGRTLVQELAKSHPLITLIVEHTYIPPPGVKGGELIEVSQSVLKKITGVENPEFIAAEIPCPKQKDISLVSRLLVLDQIADPGNLGTLLRTALALGWEGVFLTSQCVDLWNDKVIRAARGASFFLPFQIGTQEELEVLLQKRAGSCLVADARGKRVQELSLELPLTLILGNETHGPLKTLRERFSLVGIPLEGEVESLNVSIAGAILMDQLRNW